MHSRGEFILFLNVHYSGHPVIPQSSRRSHYLWTYIIAETGSGKLKMLPYKQFFHNVQVVFELSQTHYDKSRWNGVI